MKKKVAIFDIDGTIFRSSLVIELTEALIQSGVFPKEAKKIYEGAYQDWLDRKGGYERYINAVVSAFGKYIKGKKVKDISIISDKVIGFHKNRVYRFTRDLIKELKKKNYYIVVISYSPQKAVESFCNNFGFDEIFGTIYESENGKFNGKQYRIASDKSKILKFVLEERGFSLRGSVGVGDTESDIPFLKMVESPICFNPNLKLFNYAKKSNWKIVVERKDVIYKNFNSHTLSKL